jgi:predicted NACHT family NTPase
LLGLTNDALGYIISEDEYRHKTYESTISLFGPTFGSFIANESFQLLEKLRPVEKKSKAILIVGAFGSLRSCAVFRGVFWAWSNTQVDERTKRTQRHRLLLSNFRFDRLVT